MTEVRFGDQRIQVKAQESLLDALLRHGVAAKFSCRAGSCHVCLLRAEQGQVPAAAQRGLTPRLVELGYFLPCRCLPEQTLVVAPPRAEDLALSALVADKRMLGADLLCLSLEIGHGVEALPGQHVQLRHPSGAWRSYSVCSNPAEDYFLDLHIQAQPGGLVSPWLMHEVQVGDSLELTRPVGALRADRVDPTRPLLMLATGSGAGTLFAVLKQLLHAGYRETVWFLHGARRAGDFYLDAALDDLQARFPNLRHVGCCSQSAGVPSRHRPGRLTDHLPALFTDLRGWQLLMAGNPDMIDQVQAWALATGAAASDLHHDAFRRDPGDRRQQPVPADPELWRALGEGVLLHAVLSDFYARVFVDPRLAPFFVGVTRQRLIEKQYSFLKSLITGSRDYFGQRPRNAHHWMVITDELFDYRLELMRQTLIAHGVGEPWLSRCHALEERFRADIVKASALPRVIDGQAISQDGFEDAVLEVGCVCDGCERILDAGEPVRFHLRLGKVSCATCRGGSS